MMDILEIMKARHSVRQYSGKKHVLLLWDMVSRRERRIEINLWSSSVYIWYSYTYLFWQAVLIITVQRNRF